MKTLTSFLKRYGIIGALIGAAITNSIAIFALVQSNQQFVVRLRADHDLDQRKNALQMWDSWDAALTDTVRDDVKAMCRWLDTFPPNTGSLAKNTGDEYNAWLNFFVKSASVPPDDAMSLLAKQPAHIIEAFCKPTTNSESCQLTYHDVRRIRNSVVRALNVMEKVASAYQFGVADREILGWSFHDSIVGLTFSLQRFVDCTRSLDGGNHPKAWTPLWDLVLAKNGDWNPTNQKTNTIPWTPPHKIAANN